MENNIYKYSRKNVFDANGELLPIKQRTFRTKEELGAYTIILINGGSKPHYVTIKLDGIEMEVFMSSVKNGSVKNPMHPSIHGIGYTGLGNYSCKSDKMAYNTWKGVMQRCYDKALQNRYPTYKNVTVCDEWNNFQTFAKWFYEESNYQDGWHLDKDLLSDGNKVYSPKTCIFIPQELNKFMTNVQSTNTSGAIGVYWAKRLGKWHARIRCTETNKQEHLGYFESKEDASNAYINARKQRAEKWKITMKGILPKYAIEKIK